MTQACSASPDICHFTYCKPTGNDLQQGDVLQKDERLNAILRQVHPHYLKEDYTHFIILTQSCDLVRRLNGQCKARYISIAAIRPLDLVIEREIEKYQDDFSRLAGVCSVRVRFKLEQFLENLFNNNHEEYFYLHQQPVEGEFLDNSCAFLRLSIAIKVDHYDDCLKSRILSLKEIFQAKLGWMMGKMYSRVGTEDWVPTATTKEEFHRQIKDSLDAVCEWVDDQKLNEARKEMSAVEDMGQDVLRQRIRSVKIPNKKTRAINCILSVSEKLIQDPVILNKLQKRLANDPEFSSLLK